MRLLQAIERHGRGALLPIPGEAGLHLAARLAGKGSARELASRATAAGIHLAPLAHYAAARPAPNGIALGYGLIDAERIDEAVRRLARCLPTG